MPTLLTAHFTIEEFARKARPEKGFPQAAPYPEKWVQPRLLPLCQVLEVVRSALGGKGIKVGSGYRDPEFNMRIGGARASQHMTGRAADIVVAGWTAAGVHQAVLELYADGRIPALGGLGIYPNFCHLDVRPTPKLIRWTGSRPEN